MDWKEVKAFTIPEGAVLKITSGANVIWEMITYTNQIPISTDDSGNIYNGKGWKENTYVQPSGDSYISGYEATGYIPCKIGDVIRLKNITFTKGDAYCSITFFKSDKTRINRAQGNSGWYLDTEFSGVLDANNSYTQFTIKNTTGMTTNTAYIRITAKHIDNNSIITINEEIT